MAIRYDATQLSRVESTPQGGLRIEGVLTRSGIFTYRTDSGGVRKEYRPPEEVFSASHLDSFKGAPVTIGHPGVVTRDNWKQHAVGHIGEDIRQDGKFAVGTLYVQDATAVEKIRQGGLKELSCGYEVDLDPTPGEVDGERYDAVQRNIRGNHVAMGPPGWGRAGPEVAMRLDSDDNQRFDYTGEAMSDSTPVSKTKIETSEVTIRVDGQAEIDRLTAENQMLKARVDELEAAVKDTSRLDSLVEERVALVDAAKSVGVDAAGKSNRDVKVAVVLVKNPKFKMDSKASDEFVNAAYQMALTFEVPAAAPHPSLGQARADATNAALAEDPISAARKKSLTASLSAWKTSNRDALLGRN